MWSLSPGCQTVFLQFHRRGDTDTKRILEPAMETLDQNRDSVEAEIEAVRSDLSGGIGRGNVARPGTAARVVLKRRSRTVAERRRRSENESRLDLEKVQ